MDADNERNDEEEALSTDVANSVVKDVPRMLCIQAPGVVENLSAFVNCCGGRNAIQKCFKLSRERLRFKFRPGDLNTSPLYSNRKPATDIAIKVRRKKKPNGEFEESVEFLGFIDVVFDFENVLCDFQLLPTKSDICDDILKWDFVTKCEPDMTLRDDNRTTIMKQHNFSRFTTPKFVYEELMREELSSSEVMRQRRANRSCAGIFIKWEDEPPKEKTEAIKHQFPLPPHNKNLSDRIAQLFAERPVYTRSTMIGLLRCKLWNIKQTLPHHGFSYSTGPFRNCWVRYGYDVRTTPESKIYQSIDCRNKNIYGEGIRNRLSIFKDHSAVHKTEIIGQSYTNETVDLENSADYREDASTKYTAHIFKAGEISIFKRNMYQLCDVQIDEVQTLIHSNDGQEKDCTEKDGWLCLGYIDRIRKLMLAAMTETLKSDRHDITETDEMDLTNFDLGDDENEQEMFDIIDNLD